MTINWKKAEEELPEISKKYFVRRKLHGIPTVAVYNSVSKIWLIQIHGIYWQIVGVYDWAEIEKRKK